MTDLYRHFDKSGVLLYVGISKSALKRLMNHKESSTWASQIATVTIERFETRKLAEKAELLAIANEQPVHNKVGRSKLWQHRESEPIGLSEIPPPKRYMSIIDWYMDTMMCLEETLERVADGRLVVVSNPPADEIYELDRSLSFVELPEIAPEDVVYIDFNAIPCDDPNVIREGAKTWERFKKTARLSAHGREFVRQFPRSVLNELK
jgi:hypothetical protein